MSITAAQIKELNDANNQGQQAVAMLIGKWENQLFEKQLTKTDGVVFELKHIKTEQIAKVAGNRVAKNYCLHQCPWSKKSTWTLTHIASGTSIFFW